MQIIPTTTGIKKNLENELSVPGAEIGTSAGKSIAAGIGKGLAGASALVAAGVATVSAAVVKGVSDTAKYADNIDKMSQKLGLSAEAYQEWDFIAQHSGTTVDGLQSGMKTLAVAAENGKDAFAKLGLSMSEVQGMSQEELFSSVITQLQNMGASTERTALASELLGRSATELAPLLNTSAEATEEMRIQAHELGGVLSNDAVKAGAEFQDSLQNLKTSFSGLKNNLSAEFMPSLTQVMDGITALVTGDGQGIDLINQGVASFLQNLIDSIPKATESAAEIINSIVGVIIDNLPQIIEGGIRVVVKLAEGLIKAIPQLVQKIPQIITAIVGGLKSAIPELLNVGKNMIKGVWDGIVSMGSWIKEKVKNFFSGVTDTVKGILGIHSPSKVFAGIGGYMAEGLGVGFGGEIDRVQRDIKNDIGGLVDGVTMSGASINASVSGGVASNQTATQIGEQTFNLVLDGSVVSSFLVDVVRKEVRMA